jgi:hypothetical protein
MLTLDPRLTNDLTLSVEPRVRKSSTDMLLPIVIVPYTLMVEPSRAKPLPEYDEPQLMKSKTLKVDPNLLMP